MKLYECYNQENAVDILVFDLILYDYNTRVLI